MVILAKLNTKIERDIASPKTLLRLRRAMLKRLKVGDSYVFESLPIKSVSSLIASCKMPHRRFESATVEGGVRIWRVE